MHEPLVNVYATGVIPLQWLFRIVPLGRYNCEMGRCTRVPYDSRALRATACPLCASESAATNLRNDKCAATISCCRVCSPVVICSMLTDSRRV